MSNPKNGVRTVDTKYEIELRAMMIALGKELMYNDRLTAQQEYAVAYFEYLEENEFFDYCAGDALFCTCHKDWRCALSL